MKPIAVLTTYSGQTIATITVTTREPNQINGYPFSPRQLDNIRTHLNTTVYLEFNTFMQARTPIRLINIDKKKRIVVLHYKEHVSRETTMEQKKILYGSGGLRSLLKTLQTDRKSV